MSKKFIPLIFASLIFSVSMGTLVSAQGFFELSPEDRARREEERSKVEADLKARMEVRMEERDTREEDRNSRFEVRSEERDARRAEMEARRAEMDAQREAFKEERKVKIDELRAEALAKREEAMKNGIEALKEVVSKQTENAQRIMTSTVERLENIALRMDSRIEKVKALGGDTTESERLVALARTDLDGAKVKIEALSSIELTGEKVQDNFKIVREAGADIKTLLRSAHENLVSAVRALSDIEVTVTAEVNTDATVESN